MSAKPLSFALRWAQQAFALDASAQLSLNGITAVFGPSGSGKTSLLRLIAGFEKGTGRIAFAGTTWADSEDGLFVPPHRRPVGFLFQDARLFGHLSVAGNLAFAAKRAPSATEAQYREVVDALDLSPLLDRRVGKLSGGERQRVALGRTLLGDPHLLLLDEPFSALDLERKAEIFPYIQKLPERFGVPALLVSHAVEDVATLAQHMLVLDRGKIVADGPTASVFERLDLETVTGRFEAGVVVETRVENPGDDFGLAALGLAGQTLWVPARPGLSQGQSVQVRIRARDVSLATQLPQAISIQNVLPGTLLEIRSAADSPFAEALVTVGEVRLRARITRKAQDSLRLEPGQPVFALVKSVSFDPGGR